MTSDPSLAELLDRLTVIERRVREAVARRRAVDAGPDDRFRGLYISEKQVDELLARTWPQPVPDRADDKRRGTTKGEPTRLSRLEAAFGLDDLDVDILLVALAPDLDPRFERLYGYLHDDVSRRRASTGLALELGGVGFASTDRRRVSEGGALCRGGLLTVEDRDRPFLTRSLRVPDRVVLHLLGDPAGDARLEGLVAATPPLASTASAVLAQALSKGVRLAYVREAIGASGAALAHAAFRALSWPLLMLDLQRLPPGVDASGMVSAAVREARLHGAGLVAGPVEALIEREPAALRILAGAPWPVVLTGARGWDPIWSTQVPLVLDAPTTSAEDRARLWQEALGDAGSEELDAVDRTTHFRLTPDQVWRASVSARLRAEAEGRPLVGADLAHGAVAQNAAGLERLARRVEPEVGWHDLVLPVTVLGNLREITVRARLGDKVYGEWGLGGGHRGHRSLAALFAGPSGVGKTMAAEVVAGELGLDLYVIDLATVVDKYVGETEKNLDRIFSEAERVNGVIFFDEADALFGKRSEVRDARDRYANVEVAYLLQRLESFAGIAVLATNLRSNVDEAFARRFDAVVDFPLPEECERRRLWDRCLGPLVPRAVDIDLEFLARSFSLSGGNIRNIAVTAAFLGASEDRPVTMADLVRATQQEYRKLGRLCVEAEFGPYYELVAP